MDLISSFNRKEREETRRNSLACLGSAPDQEGGGTDKKPSGADFRASPGGVRRMDAPNKKPSGADFRASPGGVRHRDAPNKKPSGADFRASPEGVRHRDAPNKCIGWVSLAFFASFAVEKRFLG